MIIDGLEINSPEYWEIRHARDNWPRWSYWAMDIVFQNVPPDSRVMIVAGGQGMEAIELLKHRPDLKYIYSFDLSPTAIKKAYEHVEEAKKEFPEGYFDRIRFEVRDLFTLSEYVDSMSFDYGISIQNLEHWKPERHVRAIFQMFNPIKEGGKLFITGVGRAWDLNIMNYGILEYKGNQVKAPNDYHYVNWSEQDMYDLFMTVKAKSVRFYRRRGQDRVIAEGEK